MEGDSLAENDLVDGEIDGDHWVRSRIRYSQLSMNEHYVVVCYYWIRQLSRKLT
jgi:hypothetical protein